MSLRRPLSLAFAPVVLVSCAFAGTRHVDAALTTGANDGSSWSNAFQGSNGVQAALAAALPGDQIWVARGTYKPTTTSTRTISFVLQSGVELYGGFAGTETQLAQRNVAANPSVLDGDLNGDDASSAFTDNSYHVVDAGTSDATALLDGFTVRGGNAESGVSMAYYGGGITCSGGASPRIRNCIVRENRAWAGGGLYVFQSLPTIENTRLESNHASNQGGGMFVDTPPAELVIARCVLVANASPTGGGAYVYTGWPVDFVQCVFTGNEAEYGPANGGGALYVYGNVNLVHCTVAGNRSLTWPWGGVYSYGLSTVGVLGSIVYFNEGPGGTMSLQTNVAGGSTGAWSCVQGGLPGQGMIDLDPQFVSLAGGDLRLANTSPCCDAGNNLHLPASELVDLAGAPRFVDNPAAADTGAGAAPVVDIGAYEAPNTLFSAFCFGDGTQPTPCPCGNTGSTGRGCAASDFFSAGAALAATGTATPDTVSLACTEMLDSVTCVFLQGDQQNANGVVFGDGVRCVAGSLKRLFVKSASGGAASAPAAGDPSITTRSAFLGDTIAPGSVRYYQVYYRDPDLSFCAAPQGNSWNVSSGVILQW